MWCGGASCERDAPWIITNQISTGLQLDNYKPDFSCRPHFNWFQVLLHICYFMSPRPRPRVLVSSLRQELFTLVTTTHATHCSLCNTTQLTQLNETHTTYTIHLSLECHWRGHSRFHSEGPIIEGPLRGHHFHMSE